VFELFALAQQSPGQPELLIRACRPRSIESDDPKAQYVWQYVKSLPAMGELPLTVPRRGSRPGRHTTLELRFAPVTLAPPKKGIPRRKQPVTLWAIAAQEAEQPVNAKPLEWLLLTTMPVNTLEDAAEKIAWYTVRWLIEVFHRTLKSGCRIEDRQLGSMDSLESCLAVDMVVAWRIFHLVKLGRETPDVPCTVFFEDAQWKALVCIAKKTNKPPTTPPTLREAIRMVASFGGFLGRKSDGEPGTQTLWRGWQRLEDFTIAYEIFTSTKFLDSS